VRRRDSPKRGTGTFSVSVSDEVHKALEQSSEVTELPFYEEERQERVQDIKLKKWYAIAILAGLGAQIVIVDAVIAMYAWKGVHWDVQQNVLYVWISATVIEVIAIVLVITHHLFPRRDQHEGTN
jgi:hypothetical protein